MLSQGLLLMTAGMGTVFVFLILMVLIVQATGFYFKINEARFRDVIPVAPARQAADTENEVVAVVMAAMTTHLRK